MRGGSRAWHALAVVALVAVVVAALPQAASAQSPAPTPAPMPLPGAGSFGVGDRAGFVSSSSAFALSGSSYTLDQVDPLSGALLGASPHLSLSDSPAAVTSLAEDQALAAEVLRAAEDARRAAEARRRAELEKRRKEEEERKRASQGGGSPGAPSGARSSGSGNIVDVGRGIRVDASIAGQVRALLAAADADGLRLSGGGYRSPQGQIETRKRNCGTSHYAIYEMPSSQCRPPTARPGMSMHEKGLAIDFTNCSTRSTRCYQWLAANAARFGLYNFPKEPWHWSTNGN